MRVVQSSVSINCRACGFVSGVEWIAASRRVDRRPALTTNATPAVVVPRK
jgi:hypothetical protein